MSRTHSFEDQARQQQLIAEIVEGSGLADVDAAAIGRLSRRVRRRAAAELPQTAPHGSRFALAAAAAVFVAASLFGLSLAPSGGDSPLAVSINPDGRVQIAYADGRAPRHVTRTLDPASTTGSRLDRRERSAVVDEDAAPRPGTVVFYRVD